MSKSHGPTSESAIAAMFDRVAPRYDFLNRLLSLRQDQRWRRHLVEQIPYRPKGTMLDMATGTGDVILAAATARGEYAEFYGGDISPAMLDLAKKKAQKFARAPLLVFQSMSAEKIPLPDESVDCLTIAFGLRNVCHKAKALQEFHRVLRPQGKLLVLEFFPPQTGLFSRLFQFYFHRILPGIGGLFSDREAYAYLPKSVGSFYSATEFRAALYDNGLIVDLERRYIFGSCRLVSATKAV